jgi:hypothetical protein
MQCVGLNADPDPAFDLNADPDTGSQTIRIRRDPDPCQTLKSQKDEFLNEK